MMKVCTACRVVVLLVALMLCPGASLLHAGLTGDNATFRAAMDNDIHVSTVSGYRGKVAEYEPADDGMGTSFAVHGSRGDTVLSFHGDMQDRDDQAYAIAFTKKGSFRSRINYTRFRHYLDHDPLKNQDFVTDKDAGIANSIILEEFTAKNEMMLPSFPFVKFIFDWRNYAKRGHRQATTVTGCTHCHISSENRRVSTQLQDTVGGLQAEIGPLTVTFENLWRRFRETGEMPVTTYREDNSFYPSRSGQAYGSISDNQKSEHALRARVMLPLAIFFSASYRWGELKNRETRTAVQFNSFSGHIAKSLNRFISSSAFYVKSHADNKSPGGITRMQQRGGFSLTARNRRLSVFTLTCQWEATERRNFDVGTTEKRLCRLSYRQAIGKRLHLYSMYEKNLTSDPFVTRDSRFGSIVKTALPEKQDTVYAGLTWNGGNYLSIGASIRSNFGRYSRYDLDENRREACLSVWSAPLKNFSFSASCTRLDTDIHTPVSFSAYHYGERNTLLFTDSAPYDSTAGIYQVSLKYRLTTKVTMTGQATRIACTAAFDEILDRTNAGSYSDIRTRTVEYGLGFFYEHSRRLSFSAKYRFRDYEDRHEDFLDGRIEMVSLGIHWKL